MASTDGSEADTDLPGEDMVPGTETSGTETSGEDMPAVSVERLQLADTEIDQLVNRRERLPERERLAAASAEMRAWEAERAAMRQRLDDLTSDIERSEHDAAQLTTHRARLEAQLKTVIAPREAEALMHEMATLDEQRDAVETAELEALEEQAALDDRLTEHLAVEEALRSSMRSADDALASEVADIDAEIAGITLRRDVARAEVSEGLLTRYDRVRSASGIAVARLVGHRCDGCHLDLSAAEVDDVKDEAKASGGIADCPQCGRMLVI
ncbi:MAG: zinc ribbon domain-containing protein [Ilumatobacter sp.]|uniref:zinc ribbon domain-containing protein n=1 Tax=Ilumatobacter sp. TaxID=1967498 RepID=UPI00391BD5F0